MSSNMLRVALLCIVGALLACKPNPKLYSNLDVTTKKLYGPVVRLERRNGEFFCSGFVADDHYVITAAHCVWGLKRLIVNSTTRAKVVGYDARQDYALVIGDFRAYQRLPFMYRMGVSAALRGRKLHACGYPGGSYELLCQPAIGLGSAGFFHMARGELYPGMSGGPVIDAETGVVVGLNSRVNNFNDENPETASLIFFSRLTGFPGFFNIEPGGEIK